MTATIEAGTGALMGGMQDWPLTVDRILDHASRAFPEVEVATRRPDGSIAHSGYAAIAAEARALSRALGARGIGAGDRVATLAWNGDHHLALWYAISGMGAVTHPLNPRMSRDQLVWIANQAADRILFLDPGFLPLAEALAPALPQVETYVVLAPRADLPANAIGAIGLDEFIASGRDADPVRWGGFPEDRAASLFYTSGTTSAPKGVLYSHRSCLLNAMFVSLGFGLGSEDTLMPVVPLFHANGWGMAHVAPMLGKRLVLPGPSLDPASLHELMEREAVTVAAGVPTIWTGLLAHLRETGQRLTTVRRLLVAGSAVPTALIRAFRDEFGVLVQPAWGMTETSPAGTVGGILSGAAASDEEELAEAARQGRFVFGVEMQLHDEQGTELPWDGETPGRLMVRGPCVVASYYKAEAPAVDAGGWFDTGDVAVMHPDAVMQITDRAKDVIKSGGEWISSVAIEEAAAQHPCVEICAVIAVPHEKWGERPLLLVKRAARSTAGAAELRAHLETRLDRWCVPDAVEFVDELPLGSTGKVDKKLLRSRSEAERAGQKISEAEGTS